LLGILVAGILRVVLNPTTIFNHLGRGRFSSVIKAAFFGVPLPLCSCGVLPAAASLKKQGANKGATSAFLISTPESGVDSIAITYALLDPIMTVVRPIAAFVTAMAAGFLENIIEQPQKVEEHKKDLSCPIDNCCDGIDCDPREHRNHHSLMEKVTAGIKFGIVDVWGDIVIWFFAGLVIAGVITALIPDELMTKYLGGGIHSMLIMLVVGVPLYICATASTPVAAALILKGVSPGAALVFLLAGPATNVTSLSVLYGILGRKSAFRYLAVLSLFAVLFGLAVDQIYRFSGIVPQAVIGEASEVVPYFVKQLGAIFLLFLSVQPFYRWFRKLIKRKEETVITGFPEIPLSNHHGHKSNHTASCGCKS